MFSIVFFLSLPLSFSLFSPSLSLSFSFSLFLSFLYFSILPSLFLISLSLSLSLFFSASFSLSFSLSLSFSPSLSLFSFSLLPSLFHSDFLFPIIFFYYSLPPSLFLSSSPSSSLFFYFFSPSLSLFLSPSQDIISPAREHYLYNFVEFKPRCPFIILFSSLFKYLYNLQVLCRIISLIPKENVHCFAFVGISQRWWDNDGTTPAIV